MSEASTSDGQERSGNTQALPPPAPGFTMQQMFDAALGSVWKKTWDAVQKDRVVSGLRDQIKCHERGLRRLKAKNVRLRKRLAVFEANGPVVLTDEDRAGLRALLAEWRMHQTSPFGYGVIDIAATISRIANGAESCVLTSFERGVLDFAYDCFIEEGLDEYAQAIRKVSQVIEALTSEEDE